MSNGIKIWVDADACPGPVKDILFRAARRVKVPLILVANQRLRVPPDPLFETVLVGGGPDVAGAVFPGDLVITADVPLAGAVVEKGAFALNPRGELYTAENIRQALSIRNFMADLRSSGVQTGGPAALSPADRQAFANALDQFLTRRRIGSS